MTDPRYLVPLSALPFTPYGVAICQQRDGPRNVPHLDLSAPPKRGDIPERLDALGWALAVLAKRVGWSGGTDAFWWSDDGSAGFASDDGPDAVRFFVQIWPDTIGLSPADATRAIVAQALRTHVQTESP